MKDVAFLYVIGTKGGPTKIGQSSEPHARLADVRRRYHSPGDLIVVGEQIEGRRMALNIEHQVHWRFLDRHIRGEWFNITPEEAVQTIKATISGKGEINSYHLIPPIKPPGRKFREENIPTIHPIGTKSRIQSLLSDGESQSELIREAVERELKRRERKDK